MKKTIKKILRLYSLIEQTDLDVNGEVLEAKLSVDLAIKHLIENKELTAKEIQFIELIKDGNKLVDVSKKLNISFTRACIVFTNIANKIYRTMGDL